MRRAHDERLGAWLAFEREGLSGAVLPENFQSPENSPRQADAFAVNLTLPPAPLAVDTAPD